MIALTQPMWLAAAAPWAIALVVLAHRQRRALEWLCDHTAPRFRRDLSRYTRGNLPWHFVFLFLLGALAIVAAAGPYTVGAAERTIASRSVLLVLDASLSMGATDTAVDPETAEKPANRFVQARDLAAELVAAMPDASFGLVTFSGVTVVHSPPTRDHRALSTLLETLSYHVDLTLSGTRYSSAFDAVIHLVQHRQGSYQVVLLSDGELPQTDDYAEALDVLSELQVPVHTVALGTEEGENRVIYEPEDVINSVAEKRVARKYHTRRIDGYLEAIASETGGQSMVVADGAWAGDLVPVLQAVEPAVLEVTGQAKEDLSAYPLSGFLLGFLIETLVICRRPRRRPPTGRRAAAARTPSRKLPALAALLTVCLMLLGCRPRVLQAHYHNELGVGLFETGQHSAAAARFEKSLGYKVRRHVPLYNLGNNAAAQEEFAVAHDYYQEAMLEEPRLVAAHYNDGHALYRWGEQEIDREECRFDRAQQLFNQAVKRFRHAIELAGPRSDLGRRASEDAEAMEGHLAELAELAESCIPPPPPPAEGDGGGGGGGAGAEPPPEDSPPQDGDPPPGSPPPGSPPPGSPPPGSPPPGSPPPGSSPPGSPPPSGEGPAEPGEGSGGGLSQAEQDEVRAALERIQQEAAGASGYRQSQHQQISEDTVGKAAGMELWW